MPALPTPVSFVLLAGCGALLIGLWLALRLRRATARRRAAEQLLVDEPAAVAMPRRQARSQVLVAADLLDSDEWSDVHTDEPAEWAGDDDAPYAVPALEAEPWASVAPEPAELAEPVLLLSEPRADQASPAPAEEPPLALWSDEEFDQDDATVVVEYPLRAAAAAMLEAPTREIEAHSEDFAALAAAARPTCELQRSETPTRELSVRHVASLAEAAQGGGDGPRARMVSGLQPRVQPDRGHDEDTVKIRPAENGWVPNVEELLAMLGPSPTPDLGNIEIYYRLACAHLEQGDSRAAHRAFLTVEEISPGYRDAGVFVARLASDVYAGPAPLHRLSSNSGYVSAQGATASDKEPARRRRS